MTPLGDNIVGVFADENTGEVISVSSAAPLRDVIPFPERVDVRDPTDFQRWAEHFAEQAGVKPDDLFFQLELGSSPDVAA